MQTYAHSLPRIRQPMISNHSVEAAADGDVTLTVNVLYDMR